MQFHSREKRGPAGTEKNTKTANLLNRLPRIVALRKGKVKGRMDMGKADG
jgi:hypothetical protein